MIFTTSSHEGGLINTALGKFLPCGNDLSNVNQPICCHALKGFDPRQDTSLLVLLTDLSFLYFLFEKLIIFLPFLEFGKALKRWAFACVNF